MLLGYMLIVNPDAELHAGPRTARKPETVPGGRPHPHPAAPAPAAAAPAPARRRCLAAPPATRHAPAPTPPTRSIAAQPWPRIAQRRCSAQAGSWTRCTRLFLWRFVGGNWRENAMQQQQQQTESCRVRLDTQKHSGGVLLVLWVCQHCPKLPTGTPSGAGRVTVSTPPLLPAGLVRQQTCQHTLLLTAGHMPHLAAVCQRGP